MDKDLKQDLESFDAFFEDAIEDGLQESDETPVESADVLPTDPRDPRVREHEGRPLKPLKSE